MRMFVAVELPIDTRAALAEAASGWEIPGKVAPPANWHVTLRFIGGMDPVAIDRLSAELDQADLGGGFDAVLGEMGAFPKPRTATVLWLGFRRGADRLAELAEAVNGAVDRIGHGVEDRPFVPHLTLSRIRPPEDARRLIERAEVPPIRMPVDTVTVFSSVTGQEGPIYEAVERIPL